MYGRGVRGIRVDVEMMACVARRLAVAVSMSEELVTLTRAGIRSELASQTITGAVSPRRRQPT